MKAAATLLLVLTGWLIIPQQIIAQTDGGATDRYRGTSRYGIPATPVQPGQPYRPVGQQPMQQPMPQAQILPQGVYQFRNLVTNTAFYFFADTNQSFLWMKISSTSASNTVNKKVAKLPSAVWVKPHVIGSETAAPAPTAEGGAAPAESTATAEQQEQAKAFERRYGIKQNQAPR